MESASCAIQYRVGSISLRFGASSWYSTPDRAFCLAAPERPPRRYDPHNAGKCGAALPAAAPHRVIHLARVPCHSDSPLLQHAVQRGGELRLPINPLSKHARRI